jgi:hypothetical protein
VTLVDGERFLDIVDDVEEWELFAEYFDELVRREAVEDPDATGDGDDAGGGLLDRFPWVG